MTNNITDLLLHSLEQKPIDFEASFRDALQDRLADAIDAKKVEVAKSLFNPSDEESDEETFEHDDEQESEEETEEELEDEQDA